MKTIVIWIGGIALLCATFIDTIAVIGRHIGLPLSGSIELMQAVVLVSGAVGIVMATWENSHARVRILVDRLAETSRVLADRLSDVLTLLFVVCLLAGSVWLAADLWDGFEQSEVLGVPWKILRLIANICLLATASILLVRIVRGTRS